MAEHKRSISNGNQPISRHPLFPAIVALWFGALFGLGSIAIRPVLIERLVSALGIDSIIPMAAPPLGTTTRILIALTMTALGVVIGALLVRKLARPAAELPARRRRGGAAATDEAAADTLPTERERTGGRRLALTAGSAEHADATATPGRGSPILDVADFDLASFDDPVVSYQRRIVGAAGSQSPDLVEENRALAPASDAASSLNSNLFETYSRDISARTESSITPSAFTVVTPPTPGFKLIPPLGEEAEAEVLSVVSDEPDQQPGQPSGESGITAADRIASAELDELSPLELLERLALAMAQRRERKQPVPAFRTDPDTSADDDAEYAAATTLECVEPLPRLESHARVEPPVIPAALRPVILEASADYDDEESLPGYIPPRHIGLIPSAPTVQSFAALESDDDDNEGEDEDEDGHEMEEGYSSLLNLSRPLHSTRHDPLREEEAGDAIEEQQPAATVAGDELKRSAPFAGPAFSPAASAQVRSAIDDERLFDGPGDGDPEETERALRAALATLQRMSGTA